MPSQPSARTVKKPPALRPGDLIALVAPGSPISGERLRAGAAELERLGYRVRFRDDITATDTFFAGSHARRFREFSEELCDPEVKAIICARGGYGSNYLIGQLAADTLPAIPKIVMGYSDNTTLLLWLRQHAGWVTLHGPMATVEFAAGGDAYDLDSFRHALTCTTSGWSLGDAGARTLRQGTAEGTLTGGCLPMLVATLGTAREIETDGCLLLLEDVAEKPYQIDRMLFQLREAGKLNHVRGILFGEMKDCVQHAEQGYTLETVVLRALEGLSMPVIFGLRSGHTTRGNITLPLGVTARLTAAANPQLEILEPAVV